MTAVERKSDFNSQQTPHTSRSGASYGVTILRYLEKIDSVIKAPYCIAILIALHMLVCFSKHSNIQYMNLPFFSGRINMHNRADEIEKFSNKVETENTHVIRNMLRSATR